MKNSTDRFSTKHLDPYYNKQMSRVTEPSFTLYGSKLSQKVRFDRIFDTIKVEGRALIDIGAGVAEFYDECQRRGQLPSKYVATEPMPQVFEGLQKLHPELDNRMIDILEEEDDSIGKFDVALAIGVSAIKLGSYARSDQYWKEFIEKAFSLLNDQGVLVFTNFSHKKSEIRDEDYIIDPTELFNFAMRLTDRVILDHSYMPHDFMLFMYKGDNEWRREWKKGAWEHV